jgi:multiple sugar transport system substrate-binding protein
MSSSSTRRQFIKAAAAGGTASLAGCLGSFTGGSGGSTTLEYWEYFHSQSGVAEELMKSSVETFQKNHDVSMKMNWSSWNDITGGKWKSNMQNGNFPVIYDSTNSLNGQFIKPGWVKPVDEYIDRLDTEAVKNAQHAFDITNSCYRGFEADLYEVPIGLEAGAPFIARADHFEKAGLSIEEDFPPKNYDDLVRVAKQLQKRGPAKYGFQIYGSSGDVTDEAVVTWSTSAAGYDGLYLNKDWSDVNYDNDAWKTALKQWVDLYQRYGFSSQQASTASNEAVAQMLISGDVSMSQTSSKDFGLFRSRAPDMLKSGKLRFGPSWKGKAGNRGEFFTQCVALMRRPKGVDKKTWQAREDLAIEWINKLLSKEFQKQVPKSLATLPVRQDVQKSLKSSEVGGKSRFVETLDTIVSDLAQGWATHPDMTSIQYDIAGPLFQQAVRGKISPEKACNTAAKRIRNQIQL